jgi:hypothetical protein
MMDLEELSAEGRSPALEAIRQVIRQELARADSPILTKAEAMAMTGHRSPLTFRDWCRRHGIQQVPSRAGMYARTAIASGLRKDLRGRK